MPVIVAHRTEIKQNTTRMHAALARLQIKPKNQQIYILIRPNSILAFPAAKTRSPRHMGEKKPELLS